MIIEEDDYLEHYGIIRRSGRYPWGSGGNVATRSRSFLDWIKDLRNKGLSEVEIAKGVGLSTTELRATNTIARHQTKAADIAFAQRLKDKGWSNVAIGERMGINESVVRSLLAPGAKDKNDLLSATSDKLKQEVDAGRWPLDVGSGVEQYVGVSATKLNAAVAMLRAEGYELHSVKNPQLGTGHETEYKVLCPPGTTQKDAWMKRNDIQQVVSFSEDGGRTFLGLHPPLAVDPKRVGIKYAEDGGNLADGVIYIRPGVDDISIGGSSYAQVRIQVGDGHYLKGMAMYKDDLPDGVDLQFNTNKLKSENPNKLDVMKPLKKDADGNVDSDNPFGSQISRQIVERDSDGSEKVVSAMNIVNEEGDWSGWSNKLSSQMLSKQSPALAKSQLNVTFEAKQKEFDEIMALTNPTVKKKMLESFADDVDASAVHLKAASLPRTGQHVILPIDSLPETQIYAPNYKNGETVVLIRHPHGGQFEIPELVVNNNNREAKKALGQARDAVGINQKVAQRLSGADFDGDTVLVIPNPPKTGKIQSKPALSDLKDFDPIAAYPAYPGMPKMTDKMKQNQMGQVSNLITDMTIKGASLDEISRAVRHSMVVIDAEKHNLNYKQSALDRGIVELKEKYQGGPRSGASTLISLASSEIKVPEKTPRRARDGGPVDPKTGEKVYTETGRTYLDRQGNVQKRMTTTTRLADTSDASTLSSGQRIETVYAEHSNKLKALANTARREAINTPRTEYSQSARTSYETEVASLNSKLNIAIRNRPLERQAQVLANTTYQTKRQANPNMDDDERKKVKDQALREARRRTGADKEDIKITPKEWDAIQAGAISDSKLKDILNNADLDLVKKLATPHTTPSITPAMVTRAQAMFASGYTRADVANQLGVPLGTLDEALYG